MFLRVMQGTVVDRQRVRTSLDEMAHELSQKPGSWLGMTAGITADDAAIVVARYVSESDAPGSQQNHWWVTMSGAFADRPAVHEYRVVIEQLGGNPHDAGFVQVMQGQMIDVERTEHLLEDVSRWQAEARPDLIGGVLGLHVDGGFTQVAYFTSETSAREGERTPWPPEVLELDPLVQHTSYLDLPDPWMYAPD